MCCHVGTELRGEEAAEKEGEGLSSSGEGREEEEEEDIWMESADCWRVKAMALCSCCSAPEIHSMRSSRLRLERRRRLRS